MSTAGIGLISLKEIKTPIAWIHNVIHAAV